MSTPFPSLLNTQSCDYSCSLFMFMLELAPEIETDMFTVLTCVLHLLTVFFHITTFYWMFIEGKEIVSKNYAHVTVGGTS